MAQTMTPERREKVLVLLLACSLVCMLFVLLKDRLLNPGLTVQTMQPRATNESQNTGGNVIGTLMREVGQHPDDPERLLQLVQALMQTKQWDTAESFARRAVGLTADQFEPYFLLGVILHNKGAHTEAAENLEKAIALRDDASARYSLGVLYLYFLDQQNKGVDQLQKALQSQDLSPALKESVEAELAKQRQTP